MIINVEAARRNQYWKKPSCCRYRPAPTTSRAKPRCPLEIGLLGGAKGIRTLGPARDNVAVNVARNGSEVADLIGPKPSASKQLR